MDDIYNSLTFGLMCVVTVLSVNVDGNMTVLDDQMCEHLCNNMQVFRSSQSDFRIIKINCQGYETPAEEGKYFVKKCEGWYRRQDPKRATQNLQMTPTRILVLPYKFVGIYTQARQINLLDNTVLDYPYLKLKHPAAAACIYSIRKVLMSTTRPSVLFFFHIDSIQKEIVKRGESVWFCGIAVDEIKEQIFLSSVYPKYSLFTMTIEGTYFKSIKNGTCTYNIAVDPSKSVIYGLCLNKCISKYTYHGNFLEKVFEGNVGKLLSVDTTTDALYFQIRKGQSLSVYRTNMSEFSPKKMPGLHFKVSNIISGNDKLYVSPFPYRGVILQIRNTGSLTNITVGGGRVKVILCAIP